MTKIYVTGKVVGVSIQECAAKFGKIKRELQNRGMEVTTPYDAVGNWNIITPNARLYRRNALRLTEEIYMLPCSENDIEAHADLWDAINFHPNLKIHHELKNVENENKAEI